MTNANLHAATDAQPPMPPEARARFQRFRFGDVEALVASDGGAPLMPPPGVRTDQTPMLRVLACLLLRMPETGRLVLIDAGWGPDARRAGRPLPTAGRLLESLASAGVAPGDIDDVLISHIHPDHVGGLFNDDGNRIFPNASYHAGAEEVAFWAQDPLDLSHSPASAPLKEQMAAIAKRMLACAGGTLRTFRAGEDAVPGIATMALPGHTPGQVGFVLSGGSGRLLYTADAMTTPELSIDTPERHNAFDLDPVQAVQTRYRLLGTMSEPGWHGFTPHFPWPNLGQVRAEGDRFIWLPAPETPAAADRLRLIGPYG